MNFIFLGLLSWLTLQSHGEKDNVSHVMSKEQQREILYKKRMQCVQRQMAGPSPPGTWCTTVFDGAVCWNSTKPGTTITLPCPNYVEGFSKGMARRYCDEDGSWFVHPVLNKSWTNYSECIHQKEDESTKDPLEYLSEDLKIIAVYMPKIKLMENIGYAVSLCSLVVAVIILLGFSRLHCPRNTVHIHLFMSFILRATMALLKDNLFIDGLGLQKDVSYHNGTLDYTPHWECKLMITLWHYCLMVNYFWILMEGLYLHNLIFLDVFTEKSGILWYCLSAWGGPLLFILPWVAVRIEYEDKECWNINHNKGYFWIIRGPISLSIALNFIFFVNILRVLYTKLKRSHTPEVRKYRKLAKSTLVLVPLFGVHYMIFIGLSGVKDYYIEVIWLSFDLFFSSFQGLFVALLFCFFNGEVQYEIKKRWNRFWLDRGRMGPRMSNASTIVTHMSKITRKNSTDNSNSVTPNGSVLQRSSDTRSSHSQKSIKKRVEIVTVELNDDGNDTADITKPMITYRVENQEYPAASDTITTSSV